MKFLDIKHPFFRPLGVRIAVTAVCLGWAAFEFVSGAPFWGILFGAVGLYCGWEFFIAFDPKDYEDKDG